eukprot:m.34217 g.34217  ORF g.34217 m.34217 type:complete len:602 (+) comp9747_c0_seq2:178-1983(+)
MVQVHSHGLAEGTSIARRYVRSLCSLRSVALLVLALWFVVLVWLSGNKGQDIVPQAPLHVNSQANLDGKEDRVVDERDKAKTKGLVSQESVQVGTALSSKRHRRTTKIKETTKNDGPNEIRGRKVAASVEEFEETAKENAVRCGMAIIDPANFLCTLNPGPVREQCCCRFAEKRKKGERRSPYDRLVHCLPSYFIIGAQKSGSTALSSYMLFHPAHMPARRKEGHFFDKVGHRMVHPAKYSTSFETYNASQPVRITGDATPSYILSEDYAKYLHLVFPDTRLVLILRDPTDRFFSEYNMKLRRVQAEFSPSNDTFVTIVSNLASECFRKENMKKTKRSAFHPYVKCIHEPMKENDASFRHTLSSIKRAAPMAMCFLGLFRNQTVGLSDPFIVAPKAGLEDARNCLSSEFVKFEHLLPLEDTFQLEARKIDESMVALPSASGPCASDVDREECLRSLPHAHEVMFNTSVHYPEGSDSNIEHHFVFRGLYLEQIKWYHKYFNKEQLLILFDTELRNSPGETMARVYEHVGLPPFDVSSISQEKLHERINMVWPSFEETTGWKFQSKPPKPSAKLRNQVCAFYAPHNARLAKYLDDSLPLTWCT